MTDIILRRVGLADSMGTVYMLKHINSTRINWITNVKFDMIPAYNVGSGLIDPSSAPELLSVICEGSNCDMGPAKSALYQFVGLPPKGSLIVYGSRYVPNPLAVAH